MSLPIFHGTVAQQPDRYDVVAHTPDPTAYHVQGTATMIPRHTPFGASRGFQIKAGVVRLVDIDSDSTPGTMVDIELLNSKAVRQALEDTDGDAHAAMLKLGTDQGYKVVYGPFTKVQQREERSNPVKQGYVVPKSTPGGSQYAPGQEEESQYRGQQQMPLPRQVPISLNAPASPTSPPAPQPAPVVVPYTQAVAPTQSGQDSMMMAMLLQMQNQTAQIAAALAGMNQRPAEPIAAPPVTRAYTPEPEPTPEPAPQVMAAGGAVKASAAAVKRGLDPRRGEEPEYPAARKASVTEAIDEFMESIGLGYLTAVPSKPTYQVYFDLGEMGGRMAAWYHKVNVLGRNLTLTYDHRYESGMQFVPPFLGANKTMTVSVPKLNKAFTVYSGDVGENDGPLDKCTLIIASSEALNEEEAGQ